MEGIVSERQAYNEALCRCFVNFVIFNALIDEQQSVKNLKSHPEPQSISSSIRKLSPIRQNPAQSMNVFFEAEVRQTLKYDDKWFTISGYADYVVGYKTSSSVVGTLIVVEAKRRYKTAEAYPQLLCYMAMINRVRKQEGKDSSVVYGVATDGFDYKFWRLDSSSVVTNSALYEWHKPSDRQRIYSTFRSIIRAAMLSTPTTSPIKSDTIATMFKGGSEHHNDYGTTAKWGEFFETSQDDPNVDILGMNKFSVASYCVLDVEIAT